MRYIPVILLLLLFALPVSAQRWQDTDTLCELTQAQVDSLCFRFSHHYTINFNFRLKSDSLVLIPNESDFVDTCVVLRDELLVVADIRQADTVWVKLYRDQITMGWVSEQELLRSAIPDDVISEIIDFFESHTILLYLILSALLAVGVLMYRINRLYSVAYVLLTLALSMSVWYVVETQHDFWQEFYFHPTLNPFVLPRELKVAVLLFWTECVMSIALIFVTYDYFSRQSTPSSK
ncbi:MAG: hypothetical protein MJY59_05650 [Bacteroidaceae bacterium]|nr:hypothetical protein [Bacteroidaceae bacterium]